MKFRSVMMSLSGEPRQKAWLLIFSFSYLLHWDEFYDQAQEDPERAPPAKVRQDRGFCSSSLPGLPERGVRACRAWKCGATVVLEMRNEFSGSGLVRQDRRRSLLPIRSTCASTFQPFNLLASRKVRRPISR